MANKLVIHGGHRICTGIYAKDCECGDDILSEAHCKCEFCVSDVVTESPQFTYLYVRLVRRISFDYCIKSVSAH